ncbi:MAG: DUF559 domain-containing protein [Spirochaetota bacterium]
MNKGVKTPDYIIQLARDMRNNMTIAEKKLWSAINKKQIDGFKFRNQHPVNRYILDFYCDNKQLAIEVDGDVHIKKQEDDKYRDEFLNSLSIRVLRFSNNDIMTDLDTVINKIKKELSA